MRVSSIHLLRDRCARRAFTLIELLTVIVIIGILASLTVGVAGMAARHSKVSRTQAELARLDLAIRDYKAYFGFYPPDNVISPADLTQNPVVNQLYYELSGAIYDGGKDAYIANGSSIDEAVPKFAYVAGFGGGNLAGIYNSSSSKANVKNFLQGGRAGQSQFVNFLSYPPLGRFAYRALTVPVAWPVGHSKAATDPRFLPPFQAYTTDRDVLAVNPWHYNVTNPTNNPGEFDLWADIVVGNDFITIGNWKEEQ
jgi:prepilin-type N-terminal cleavage/methylation domain-containing protein